MNNPVEIYKARIREMGLPPSAEAERALVMEPIAQWVSEQCGQTPFVLGVSGAQGSGKSSFCRLLSTWLGAAHGLRAVELSIDDLYRTQSERQTLAKTVHPLCAVRGVPGTHDVDLGHRVLGALRTASSDSHTSVPRFDKRTDDRAPTEEWSVVVGKPDVILFEGWCVGATVPPPNAAPTNDRERREDPDGTWRVWSDAALASDYSALFDELDALAMIKVPSMDAVREGRWRQEQRLWAEDAPGGAARMSQAEVHDFIALYERLTLHLFETLPRTADILIHRDADFRYTLTRMPPSV